MSSNSPDRSLDAAFDVLSDSTRRYVLWYLGRESVDARVSVETLATEVAAWRTGEMADGDADRDARQRAHASLRHVHLPRLESAGLIERTREGRVSESVGVESGGSGAEYVEATTEDTPIEAFLDAELLGEFAAPDRP